MIRNGEWRGETSREGRGIPFSLTLPFMLVAAIIALLLAGAFRILDISYIFAILVAIVMIASIIVRWDPLAVSLVLVVHICFDWYMGHLIVGQVLAFALLVIYFLFRSPRYPWTQPRALWLWGLYLLVSISPAVRGVLSRSDAAYYYPFPIGLFTRSITFPGRLLYLVEIFLMIVALLFTYTLGAWLAAIGGMIAFILLAGRGRYRVLIPSLVLIMGLLVMTLFPSEVNLLLNRLANPATLLLRLGAWQTAIQVIDAFPLTGLGLGLSVYLQGAEAYRTPSQYRPLAHPHNSYLELGAMGGLPVLFLLIVSRRRRDWMLQ